MGKQRRQFNAGFKAKVALEAIKVQRTVQEIASTFSVHPNQVAQWKRQALENLAELFTDGRRRTDLSDEELKSELYRQIGRLQMEIEWLKKSPVYRIGGETGMDRARKQHFQHEGTMQAGWRHAVGSVLQAFGRNCRESDADEASGRTVHGNTVLWRAADDGLASPGGLQRQPEARSTLDATNGIGSNLPQTKIVAVVM